MHWTPTALADSTLVIATSDHGAAPYAGNVRKATPGLIKELEKLGHYSSGIYRGYKFTVFEGGLRVPFVVRWPGTIEPGSRCDRLVGLNDLAATLAEVAGIELGDSDAPDSHSILPLLRNPAAEGSRTTLVMQSPRGLRDSPRTMETGLTPSSGSRGVWGTLPDPKDAWDSALRSFGSRPLDADLRKAPFVQLFDLAADVRENDEPSGRACRYRIDLERHLGPDHRARSQHSRSRLGQRHSVCRTAQQRPTLAATIRGATVTIELRTHRCLR